MNTKNLVIITFLKIKKGKTDITPTTLAKIYGVTLEFPIKIYF